MQNINEINAFPVGPHETLSDGFGHPEPLLVQQDTNNSLLHTTEDNSPVNELENCHELNDIDMGHICKCLKWTMPIKEFFIIVH